MHSTNVRVCCCVYACSAKKRPRVAAAPERYADLVSNMTSQGGAEDTDSDADDAGDRHEVSP
jgi:hypothetical protein